MSEVEPWLRDYLPQPGSRLALDVGANIGNWTAALAERCGEVHAFEPNPQCHHMLRGFMAARQNVRLCEFAVGDDVGEMLLRQYPHHSHASAFVGGDLDTISRGEVTGTLKVPLVTLDGMGYQWRPVDFIKVDTEGGERDVLWGARETLAFSQPSLLVEVHTAVNRDWLVEWLPSFGYEPTVLPHPHEGVPDGHCWIIADRPPVHP